MSLLATQIALWLGHESIETTLTYLHAHLSLKEAVLAKLKPYQPTKPRRFQPPDRLLAFLDHGISSSTRLIA